MDTSSDKKKTKSRSRKLGTGEKREILEETESLLIATQNSARIARIDKTQQNSKCGLCGDRDEKIYHIIEECCK